MTCSSNENSIQVEQWESLSACDNAFLVLIGGPVNTKHLTGSNKEAMMTYYNSGRAIAATGRDLYAFF